MDLGKKKVKLGWVINRKARQATFQQRRTNLQQHAGIPDSDKGELDLQVEGFHHQRLENLRKEVDMKKLTNRDREVFIVLADLLAGRHQILDSISHDLATDALAVLQLRKKIVSERIKSLMMASQEPTMVAPQPTGGELFHGSFFLERVAAVMANDNGGVQPTDAEVERFLGELVLLY